jgi:hypothetical protein
MSNGHDLQNQFHRAMLEIYDNALRECGYNAIRFLQMVRERGGVETARRLLYQQGFQYGFEKLWECGRLDLTMEALVLRPQFASLFTEEEKQIASNRLADCGYDIA